MEIAEVLKDASLFAPLSRDQRDRIVALGKMKNFKGCDVVFKQGQPADIFYVLLHGCLRLTVEHPDELDLLAETIDHRGAIFGMAALTKNARYNVTATCKDSAAAFAVEAKGLREIIRQEPSNGLESMAELAQLYSNRLNNARATVNTMCRIFASQSHKTELSHAYWEGE
ncbi:MAG: cyclic nucleotide-binding domain-containing protein [Thermodesulfobacteriota bacterium]|nr:cyclic nucleotide-binding domain-containing protein [Thermodesulfobacteriota bacterium]